MDVFESSMSIVSFADLAALMIMAASPKERPMETMDATQPALFRVAPGHPDGFHHTECLDCTSMSALHARFRSLTSASRHIFLLFRHASI